jgi:hypothetical protein
MLVEPVIRAEKPLAQVVKVMVGGREVVTGLTQRHLGARVDWNGFEEG